MVCEVDCVVAASEHPSKKEDQRLAAPGQELYVTEEGQHPHQEGVVGAGPGRHVAVTPDAAAQPTLNCTSVCLDWSE